MRPRLTIRGIRQRRGFTLIEVLLSVTILATLSAIAFTAITQMFKTEEVVNQRQERYRMARLAMNRMADEISMAYVAGPDHGGEQLMGVATGSQNQQQGGNSGQQTGNSDQQGQQEGNATQRVYEPVQFGMIGRDDELDFTSFGHVRTMEGEKTSRHAQIGYGTEYYTDENGERARRLYRRYNTGFDDDVTDGGVIHTMIPEVEELEFEFWDPGEPELGTRKEMAEQGRWVSEWDTTSREQSGRLPTRVRIRLTLPPKGPRGESETFVTQTTLGMPELLEY